jgi:hypothetical protein
VNSHSPGCAHAPPLYLPHNDMCSGQCCSCLRAVGRAGSSPSRKAVHLPVYRFSAFFPAATPMRCTLLCLCVKRCECVVAFFWPIYSRPSRDVWAMAGRQFQPPFPRSRRESRNMRISSDSFQNLVIHTGHARDGVRTSSHSQFVRRGRRAAARHAHLFTDSCRTAMPTLVGRSLQVPWSPQLVPKSGRVPLEPETGTPSYSEPEHTKAHKTERTRLEAPDNEASDKGVVRP